MTLPPRRLKIVVASQLSAMKENKIGGVLSILLVRTRDAELDHPRKERRPLHAAPGALATTQLVAGQAGNGHYLFRRFRA